MNWKYDLETDTLTIRFREGKIVVSREEPRGIIWDFDEGDNIVAVEILFASRKLDLPAEWRYQAA